LWGHESDWFYGSDAECATGVSADIACLFSSWREDARVLSRFNDTFQNITGDCQQTALHILGLFLVLRTSIGFIHSCWQRYLCHVVLSKRKEEVRALVNYSAICEKSISLHHENVATSSANVSARRVRASDASSSAVSGRNYQKQSCVVDTGDIFVDNFLFHITKTL